MTTQNTTTQPLPLYKRLDEGRTKGEWIVDKFDSAKIMVDTDTLCAYVASFEFENYSIPAINAQYTALAVNNLASCGDAMDETINRLQYCIDLWEMPDEAVAMIKGEIDNLNSALSRIS